MCDLQSGDVVVWVNVKPAFPGQPVKRVCGWEGRNFTISDVEVCQRGMVGVLLSDGPSPTPGSLWGARAFRRVYRPDGSLISKLLEPVDLGEEAKP